MNYDELKELCRKSWEEDHTYLFIDRSKKRDQGNIVFVMKSKKQIKKQHLRRNLFNYHTKMYFNKRNYEILVF